MTFVAACYARSGGWIGQGEEIARFLAFFALWRGEGRWTDAEFARAWPHHPGGSFFWFAQGWN